jgi:hypothetical protein
VVLSDDFGCFCRFPPLLVRKCPSKSDDNDIISSGPAGLASGEKASSVTVFCDVFGGKRAA